MARRKKGGASKRDYLTALRYFDITASPRMTKSQLKNLYIKARKEQKAKDNAELPRIDKIVEQQLAIEAETANAKQEFDYEATTRDDDMRTEMPPTSIDISTEYIEEFLNNIDAIYQETLDYINGLPNPKAWGKGRFGTAEGYFISQEIPSFEACYYGIKQKISALRSMYGDEAVANALADNVELDYVRALVFIPPSDGVVNNFEITLEQIDGIAVQLASELGGI